MVLLVIVSKTLVYEFRFLYSALESIVPSLALAETMPPLRCFLKSKI